MEAELRKTLGDDVYEELAKYLDARTGGTSAPLAHPAQVQVSLSKTRRPR
jgi:hypothetical protein